MLWFKHAYREACFLCMHNALKRLIMPIYTIHCNRKVPLDRQPDSSKHGSDGYVRGWDTFFEVTCEVL